MQTVEPATTTAKHPLDPLTAQEVEATSLILRRQLGLAGSARFVYVTLSEPAKDRVLAFHDGDAVEREAFVVIREREERKTYEAVVSLTAGTVRTWREVANVQPPVMFEEFLASELAVKKDPRWQEAMRRRGITDFDSVMLDPWSLGYNGPEDGPERGRLIRPLTWLRMGTTDDHGYARPVEGVVVRFDLDAMEVVEVEDHGITPLPPTAGNYDTARISDPGNFPSFPAGPRRDLKPIEITQPEGASFQVDGHEVRWQKWSLRVGFTPREGLVLHTIGYEDGGMVRPVIYRASLSEMFIPYGDPRPTHHRKNVFDMGEYGIGVLANSLELGCDCLGEIFYFDAVVNDNDGQAVTLRNAICLHEEDFGILWKHTDFRTGEVEVRRSRRLVISSIVTVGNYEYGFFWYLYQDGTIGYEVKLTGVLSTGAYDPDRERPLHGTPLAPGLYGPNHQHFFCVRLDMMVDGPKNSVYECDSIAVPLGPENPHGNAWIVQEMLLARESAAQRVANAGSARFWKIVNPAKRNAMGDPVAYKLEPGPSTRPMYQPGAHALERALFTTKNLWVTAYDPDQNFAAGDYPNQHPGGAGLPDYQSADRPLQNADVVLWHTFVAHHVPRPEEWPVMPVSYVGFHLKPFGFFDGSPALDVPVADHCHHPSGHGEHPSPE
jgi:primary-amine oxidase